MEDGYLMGGQVAVAGSVPTTEQVNTIRAFRDAVTSSDEYRAHAAEASKYVDDDRFPCIYLRKTCVSVTFCVYSVFLSHPCLTPLSLL